MEADLVAARESTKWSNMADVGVDELCQLVGERMRAHRIRIARTQAEVASSAGLSLRTYRRLEATGRGSIESLIVVLQAMGRVTAVAILFPEAATVPATSAQDRIRKYAFSPRPKRKREVKP